MVRACLRMPAAAADPESAANTQTSPGLATEIASHNETATPRSVRDCSSSFAAQRAAGAEATGSRGSTTIDTALPAARPIPKEATVPTTDPAPAINCRRFHLLLLVSITVPLPADGRSQRPLRSSYLFGSGTGAFARCGEVIQYRLGSFDSSRTNGWKSPYGGRPEEPDSGRSGWCWGGLVSEIQFNYTGKRPHEELRSRNE